MNGWLNGNTPGVGDLLLCLLGTALIIGAIWWISKD